MRLPKELTLQEIASIAGGTVQGKADLKVKSIAMSPLQAREGDLAFVFDPKLVAVIEKCQASAVMVPEGVAVDLPHIVVKRPLLAIQRMLTAVEPKRYHPDKGIHPSAVVDPSCQIGQDVAIGPLVVIGPKCKVGDRTRISAGCLIGGEVTIGSDCLLHQGCLIADYVSIGNRVILQQGASIGGDGFSYVTERPSNMELRIAGCNQLSDERNPNLKIPNIGVVIIEDDVEVGSCATIDRATMGATIIGRGTKIDNLVMIAHNCRLGQDVLVAGLSGMGGSCTLGDRAIVAGHSGLKDHLTVAKDGILEGGSAAMRDIPEGQVHVGSPAKPVREFFTELAHVRKLPKMYDEVKSLKRKVEALEKLLGERPLEHVNS